MTLGKSKIEIERTVKGFKISGREYTTLEAMFIVDWILDQLEDETKDDESVIPLTLENADLPND